MKAVLWDEPFSDPDWIFERKLDGVRCLAHRSGDGVRLVSRTDRSMNGDYPELVGALETEPCEDFVIDGEVVAFGAGGVTSFSRLQRRHRERVAIFYYVFDLLRLEGEDVRDLPLRQRKAELRRALRFEGHVRFSPHRNEDGEELFRDACRKGLEGLMAKRSNIALSAIGAQMLVSDEDVERLRSLRREDLAGQPLVWQVALRNLVSQLTGRTNILTTDD